jgi:pimeloyl-ACP methyl ester carboxylesterase
MILENVMSILELEYFASNSIPMLLSASHAEIVFYCDENLYNHKQELLFSLAGFDEIIYDSQRAQLIGLLNGSVVCVLNDMSYKKLSTNDVAVDDIDMDSNRNIVATDVNGAVVELNYPVNPKFSETIFHGNAPFCVAKSQEGDLPVDCFVETDLAVAWAKCSEISVLRDEILSVIQTEISHIKDLLLFNDCIYALGQSAGGYKLETYDAHSHRHLDTLKLSGLAKMWQAGKYLLLRHSSVENGVVIYAIQNGVIFDEVGLIGPEATNIEASNLTAHGLHYNVIRTRLETNLPVKKRCLVHFHGGPEAMEALDRRYFGFFTSYVQNSGADVFSINYQGSNGFGSNYQEKCWRRWSQGLLEDIARTQLMVKDYDEVDVFAWSFGAIYAHKFASALRHKVRRCVIGGGQFDLRSHFNSARKIDEKYEKWFLDRFSHADLVNLSILDEACTWPTLLIHGKLDPHCSVSAARHYSTINDHVVLRSDILAEHYVETEREARLLVACLSEWFFDE